MSKGKKEKLQLAFYWGASCGGCEIAVEPNRVRFEYVSASEGVKFASIVTDFVYELKKMGPNPLKEVKI